MTFQHNFVLIYHIFKTRKKNQYVDQNCWIVSIIFDFNIFRKVIKISQNSQYHWKSKHNFEQSFLKSSTILSLSLTIFEKTFVTKIQIFRIRRIQWHNEKTKISKQKNDSYSQFIVKFEYHWKNDWKKLYTCRYVKLFWKIKVFSICDKTSNSYMSKKFMSKKFERRCWAMHQKIFSFFFKHNTYNEKRFAIHIQTHKKNKSLNFFL